MSAAAAVRRFQVKSLLLVAGHVLSVMTSNSCSWSVVTMSISRVGHWWWWWWRWCWWQVLAKWLQAVGAIDRRRCRSTNVFLRPIYVGRHVNTCSSLFADKTQRNETSLEFGCESSATWKMQSGVVLQAQLWLRQLKQVRGWVCHCRRCRLSPVLAAYGSSLSGSKQSLTPRKMMTTTIQICSCFICLAEAIILASLLPQLIVQGE